MFTHITVILVNITGKNNPKAIQAQAKQKAVKKTPNQPNKKNPNPKILVDAIAQL